MKTIGWFVVAPCPLKSTLVFNAFGSAVDPSLGSEAAAEDDASEVEGVKLKEVPPPVDAERLKVEPDDVDGNENPVELTEVEVGSVFASDFGAVSDDLFV